MSLRRTKVSLALGVGVAAIVTAELYLRLFAPVGFMAPEQYHVLAGEGWTGLLHVATHRSVPTYELAPHYDSEVRNMHVHTNSLGMRGDEPLPRETPGLTRIAVIGDSMAFGLGVEYADTFPAQLDRELAQSEFGRDRRIEVLNFGVSGYSTLDELAVLRDKVLPLQPDLVLIAYCLNDPDVLPLQPLPAHFATAQWWQYSQVLRWFAGRIHGYRIRKYGDGNYWRCVHNPDGPFWPTTSKALDQIRDLCRARGLHVLFVVLPMLNGCPSWSAYRYDDLHQFISAQASARGFDVLDVSPALRDREPPTLTVAPDDPHFNAAGYQLVATAIAREIESKPALIAH